MQQLRQIERLVDSDFRLAAIATPDPERVVDLFRRLTQQTGRAVYRWSPGEGLYRLGVEHILIPRTARPADVLDYIASTIHFGVYLLPGFDEALEAHRPVELMRRIANAGDRVRRLVILLGENPVVPSALQPFTVRVRHAFRNAG